MPTSPDQGGLSFGSIVQVNDNGGCFGGTEEYIALMTAELGRRGVRSHLVCGHLTGDLPPGFASVHVVEGLGSREPHPGTGAELARTVAGLGPDVVFLHNLFDPAAVSSVAALPGRGPLVWYVHDHFLTCLSELRWRRDRGSCRERLGEGCLAAIGEGQCVLRYPDRPVGPADLARRTALSGSLGEVDGTIVVSDYMRDLLVEAEPGSAGRVHLLPRPIRDPGPAGLRPRDRPDDPAVVTFAGRITPEKGLAVLLEALGSLRDTGPVELRIAGVVEHGGYWSRCEDLRARAVGANPRLTVTYLGQLGYPATDRLLRASDIVAVPSQWPEPLGAVAIEAMSTGAAVVASDVGGLGTHLVDGRSGLLVHPSDVAGWTAAIGLLLRSPRLARRLGAEARHQASALTAVRHLDAFDSLIRGLGAARAAGPRIP